MDESAGSIAVDISLWPIVVCTPRGQVKDEHYEQMFREFEKLWRRGERFLSITDTRFSSQATPKQRSMIGVWMKANGELTKRYSLGSIVIVESVVVRGALTAINWVAQPEVASEYTKDWPQTVQAATKLLEKAGVLTDKVRASLKKLG